MKTTKVFYLLIFSSVFTINLSAQLKKLTLREAVDIGLANNLLIQQTGLQVESDAINWKQSKLNLIPNLNGNANNGISQGRSIDPFTNSYSNQRLSYSSYGVSSNLILFNGFSLRNTIKQNELTYQASVMDLQQAKDNLTIDIILAFIDVLTNEDLLKQLRDQSELTKRQVERLVVLDSNGAITPSLLYDMKGQLATDQLAMVDMQNSVDAAKLRLSQLLNQPFDKQLQLERVGVESMVARYEQEAINIYQSALERFPQIKAAELRRQSAAKSVEVAKGALYPTLSLNGSASTNYSNAARNEIFLNTTEVVSSDFVIISGNPVPVVRKQDNFSSNKIAYGKQLNNNLATSINLNLRIPIFNSFQSKNRIRLAKIDLKNYELIANSTKTQLQQFIEQAWLNMNSAWERYRVLLAQVNAYQESFRAAEIRFNAGLGTSVDYLVAKNNLERAQITLISVQYDYLLRTKVLDYYQGKPFTLH